MGNSFWISGTLSSVSWAQVREGVYCGLFPARVGFHLPYMLWPKGFFFPPDRSLEAAGILQIKGVKQLPAGGWVQWEGFW